MNDNDRFQYIKNHIFNDEYEQISHDDITWLSNYADSLKELNDFVNTELPRLKARLSAQADRVYNK